ncbi:DUF4244 domain-containing protein [Arthrobacter cupressi]|uniref:DUF4244 domain-containing protein n=1 Tax=Arthrobacter cupressi TaxID=1045773 RepID=A0A1G8KEP0_9MICC|nr:DUF4244 domain-containing protein [Arthrobacter cupressi]NYD77242.1 hypothetical protein [Arthrobacter cupressi]SDI41869.1 Protein of unknown function [Arthrobacter cupressi]
MRVQTITRTAPNPVRQHDGANPGKVATPGTSAQPGTSGPIAEGRALADVVELYPVATDTAGGAPQGKRRGRLTASELGMATAEYAIATLAAVGFAGVLVVLLRSEEVRSFLLNLIRTALALP